MIWRVKIFTALGASEAIDGEDRNGFPKEAGEAGVRIWNRYRKVPAQKSFSRCSTLKTCIWTEIQKPLESIELRSSRSFAVVSSWRRGIMTSQSFQLRCNHFSTLVHRFLTLGDVP